MTDAARPPRYSPHDFIARELKLRAAAGRVMQELKAEGKDWQEAWKTHPVAIAYRELLKEAWSR